MLKKYQKPHWLMGLYFCGLPFAMAQTPVDAVSSSLDATISNDVMEGVLFSAPAKMMIAEHYATTGRWPTTNQEIGLPEPMAGGVVAAVKVEAGGRYIIHYTPQVKNYTFEFKATIHPTSNAFEWHCVGGTLPKIYWPESCKGDGQDIAYNVNAGINFATAVKMNMAEYYATEGQWPQNTADIGLPDPYASSVVKNVVIKPNGVFEIHYTERANNYTLEFQALVDAETGYGIRWRCTGGTVPDLYRPEACIAK